MRPTLPLLLVGWALLHTCAAWAAGGTAHAVTTTADSGAGSLREAINAANSTPTSDVIGFDAALNGQTIYPLTQLPALVDGGTVIDGDIDNNGDPDIGLDGSQQSSGDGLTFLPHSDGLGCRALGLSVGRFPRYGIYLAGSHLNTIQTCHVGVSLGGAALRTNAHADLYLHQSHDNVIGGDTFAESNIFAGGNGLVSSTAGVYIFEGNNNQIQRNSFGLTRSGTAALGTGREGVIIRNGTGNVVGGGGAAKRSVFGGLKTGISVYFGAHSNSVTGCYVGTTADGYTSLPLTYGVILGADAHDNTVGGTTAAARNIFGGGPDALGVYVLNTGSVDNLICGNYFGLGPNGTTQIDIEDGVYVGSDAGSQTVGGPTEAHGNHFRCPDMGVIVRVGGAGSVIRRNRFGWRADGTAATGVSNARAIEVTDVRVTVSQCSIRGHDVGLRTTGSANPIVTKTTFANCARCVDIQSPSNPNL
ncbi:MAG: hypothetical protein FJX74_19605, partial [Armatimonadetes bacterium]|nr:hypothetical protein [Armatimonadota bacterium]